MSILNHIQMFEDMLQRESRLVVISRLQDLSDEQLEGFLHDRKISTHSDDLIVSLKRFSEGHPEPWAKIAYTTILPAN